MPAKVKSLWAKSLIHKHERPSATYVGHINQVMDAADVLLEQMAEQILDQLGLSSLIELKEFEQTTRLAAYLHDWGKASQHFQEMIKLVSLNKKKKWAKESGNNKFREEEEQLRKQLVSASKARGYRQMLRHEIISGILALQVDTYAQWLNQCPNADVMIAVWAAMGHHLKAGLGVLKQPQSDISFIPRGTGGKLHIYTQHPDFNAILKMGVTRLQLPDILPEFKQEVWSKRELLEAMAKLKEKFTEFEKGLTIERKTFIAAVKATVIAADLAGSALPKEEGPAQDKSAFLDFKDWMQEVLDLTLTSDELDKLVNDRLKGKKLYPFQENVANSSDRVTWLNAGCGGGKTVAAYAWGKKWAKDRKLFFCYPTTGTASQGFIDYAHKSDIEAELMHSRADLDREILFSGDSDPIDADAEGVNARLSAFKAWRQKLIVCTVDTVLGLMQNNRKPLYAWPAIANAAFVFDEVHAYDQRLFGALLTFLRTFRNAPILLMSASFTTQQRQAIQQVMDEIGETIQPDPIPGRKEVEILKRYDIQWFPEVVEPKDAVEIWQPVLEMLKEDGKVLWVTNSVQTCIDLYRVAQDKLAEANLPAPSIYHSRYRYKDRLKHHDDVIDKFDPAKNPGAVLAITTQVCEMSLDINADLLVTALAPAAAIIQRLGRLNRRMESSEEPSKPALIYTWGNSLPYAPEEQATGQQLMEKVGGKQGVSQTELAEILKELNSRSESPVDSCWIEGNWATYPDTLRDIGGTITVLLQDDMGEIKDNAEKKKAEKENWGFMREAQQWSVPIRPPQPLTKLRDWKRCKFYPIAPSEEIEYSDETGAEPCKS